MQETVPPWAFLDEVGSLRGVPTSEVAQTPGDDLETQLARATTALAEAEARHRAAMAAAAEQLADQKSAYELAMARNTAIWEMVDEQLREAALGVELARQGEASAVAAADRATRRASDLEAQSAADLEARLALEQAIARAEQEYSEAEARHASAMTAATDRASELQLALQRANEESESRAAEIRRLAEHEADLASQLAQSVASRAAIERQLQVTQAAIQEADARATRERLAACQRAAEREAELDGQLRQERSARADLEQAAAEAEAAARDERERHEQALAAATTRFDDLRVQFERELTEVTSARDTATERLQAAEAALDRLRQDHESAMADAARSSQLREADLTARLSEQRATIEALELQREALDRQGAERATAIEDARRRERALDETLQQEREASSRLEADLRSLQQTVATAQEHARSVERERNGLSDELSALRQRLAAAEDDASQVPRLRQRIELAHRMEAVGRLASEAAATCGNLIADVHQNVQQWLVTSNGDPTIRQRGESVLDDVTRVAGLLRQLSGYVEEQGRAPVADLGSTVRDLEPVLRRVAGQDVELGLPETGAPVRLDLSSERVDRLLVNLASYGRERMPEGGRLTIELTTVVVDREFAARHTGMRVGAYALITMTKSRPTDQAQSETGYRPRGRSGRTPGVELETLQSQVGECGGHLWMTIDPQGDMVSKLHLPLPGGASDVQ